MRARRLGIAALLAAAPAGAVGPLFEPLHAVTLEPVLPVPATSVFVGGAGVGIDAEGFLYSREGSTQCMDVEAPGERTSLSLGVLGEVSPLVGGAFFDTSGQTRFVRCPDAVLDVRGDTIPPLPFPRPPSAKASISPDGIVCYTSPLRGVVTARVECFDRTATTPTLTTALDAADLDALLGIGPPSTDLPPTANIPVQPEEWHFDDGEFGPDGTLYVIARRVTWVVENEVGPSARLVTTTKTFVFAVDPVTADTRVFARNAGAVRENSPDTLATGNDLFVSTSRQALLLTTGQPEYGHVRGAPGGLGFLVLPFSADGAGVLSLTDAYGAFTGCRDVPGNACLFAAFVGTSPEGPLLQGTPNLQFDLVRPVIDAALVDLDRDGVEAATEDRLGSSDLDVDSDDGGIADAVEVVRGTDPADAGDDGDDPFADPAFITESALIRVVLPAHLTEVSVPARAFAPFGPLCVDGTCTDARGDVIARFGEREGTRSPAVSQDGSSLWFFVGDALYRQRFSDGALDEVLSAGDLTAALDGQGTDQLAPIDEERAWVWRTLTPARAVLVTRGEAAVNAFDLQTVACGVDAPPCFHDNGGIVDAALGGIEGAGLQDDGSLLLRVDTTWRSQLFSVALDRSVALLETTTSIDGVPAGLVPLGDDAFFRLDQRANGVAVGALRSRAGLRPLGTGIGVIEAFERHVPAWGTIVFSSNLAGLGTLPSPRLLELATFSRVLQPGELIGAGVANGDPESRLLRGGRRGGLLPLGRNVAPEFVGSDAVDVKDAGDGDWRVCEVSTERDIVREFAGPQPGAPPDPAFERWRAFVEAPVDCRWEGDGRLVVLDAAGTAWARDGERGGLAPLPALAVAPGTPDVVGEPSAMMLVLDVDGRALRFTATPELPGFGFTRDGAEMRLTPTTLTIGGQVVDLVAAAAATGTGSSDATAFALLPTRLLERQDGRIVFRQVAPILVDVATDRLAPWAPTGGFDHGRFGLVPGDMPEPWSLTRDPAGGGSFALPELPATPTDGEVVRAASGCGCRQGGGGSEAVGLVALLLIVRRRRPRPGV